ncbi:hypothetical protein, partial [Saccharospirillum salsuginis]|uniref:hypothetical protein n=1 Tax=Saccharospirillum salsuginis TaxID=418750 RepID=UPI001E2ED014
YQLRVPEGILTSMNEPKTNVMPAKKYSHSLIAHHGNKLKFRGTRFGARTRTGCRVDPFGVAVNPSMGAWRQPSWLPTSPNGSTRQPALAMGEHRDLNNKITVVSAPR